MFYSLLTLRSIRVPPAEKTVWLNYCLVVATTIPILLMFRTKSVYRRSAVDDASATAAITESVSGYQPL